MVRSSREYYALDVIVLSVLERVLARLLHVLVELLVLAARGSDSVAYLLLADAFVRKYVRKFVNEILVIVIWQERMHEIYSIVRDDLIHVVGDNLRVSRNDRTVVVVRLLWILHALIVDARIEDEPESLLSQPFNVSVNYLGRIARRIR